MLKTINVKRIIVKKSLRYLKEEKKKGDDVRCKKKKKVDE